MIELESFKCGQLLGTHQRCGDLRHCLETHHRRKESSSLQLVIVEIRIGGLRQVDVDNELDLRIVDLDLFEKAQERDFRTLDLQRRQVTVATHDNDRHEI